MKLEEKIYRKLLEVPPGYVTTYGELANAINLKNGQRVVGQIMKKNPFPVIVPCHRVVKSDGTVGGYAYGIERKTHMISKEGLEINNNKISETNVNIKDQTNKALTLSYLTKTLRKNFEINMESRGG